MSDVVNYEVQGKVALITLNRPEARNAINGDVAQGLEAAINQMEEDPNVVIGILRANTTGQERPVFCAGADLKAINSGQAGSINTALGGLVDSFTVSAKSQLLLQSTVLQQQVVAKLFLLQTWL